MRGNSQTHDANANEIVLAYEKAATKGDASLVGTLRFIHSDLTKRFDEVDARTTVNVYA